jgi:hypothetical protein
MQLQAAVASFEMQLKNKTNKLSKLYKTLREIQLAITYK